MTRAQLLFGVVGATLIALGGSAVSQVELPAGPNRDIVYRKCASCHDLQNLVDTKGLSRENWNGDRRHGDLRNDRAPDQGTDLKYLAAYLPPSGR
jgi:hypothetical protein